MNNSFYKILSKGDLRRAVSPEILGLIPGRNEFSELIKFLDHTERHVRMHAVDAIEKISLAHPGWLREHRKFILEMMKKYPEKEFRCHIAQIVSRLELDEDDAGKVWDILSSWLNDKKESRIVRVFSLQAMFDLTKHYPELLEDLVQTAGEVKREKIPSINARIKKLGL